MFGQSRWSDLLCCLVPQTREKKYIPSLQAFSINFMRIGCKQWVGDKTCKERAALMAPLACVQYCTFSFKMLVSLVNKYIGECIFWLTITDVEKQKCNIWLSLEAYGCLATPISFSLWILFSHAVSWISSLYYWLHSILPISPMGVYVCFGEKEGNEGELQQANSVQDFSKAYLVVSKMHLCQSLKYDTHCWIFCMLVHSVYLHVWFIHNKYI